MKLRTHYVFSLGLLSLIDSLFLNNFLEIVVISGVLSVIVNNLIDSLGHEIRGRYISRTPRTHTLTRSIAWGLLPPVPISIIIYLLFPSYLLPIVTVIDGVMVGPSHMLLDIFTERGIYRKVNGRWKRIALAHFSYDNPIINGIAIILGALMLFIALELHSYYHYYF
ncbi:DUF1286 domain-containing protein [Acidianus sp. HS-5]|uniref:DUF1286 domain-containing protein n=1 Tax=Acidianus sp. HS-5 TaxID=2886040 RepID=UPI001F4839E9|nr:DUF1286 domain-containing protein [Acidianus sp. HS-5]